MSFFDEGDEPTRRAPRPRRPAPVGGASADSQTVLVRRAVAAVIGALFLILLVVGINSCRNSARDRALKDYNRGVAAIVQQSDGVGRKFFQLLSSKGSSTIDLQTNASQLRSESDDLLKQARKLDVPGQMVNAQRGFLLALEFRRDGIAKIAALLPTALGRTGAGDAVEKIAGDMQLFLSSDAIYSQRVFAFVNQALAEADIGGQTIATSRFFPNLTWLAPATVASRLGATSTGADGTIAPGLHGFGLLSASVGGKTLTVGAGNTVASTPDLAFTVKTQNQGESDESDVVVRISVRPQAGRAITVSKTIDQVKRGAEATVTIPLGRTPPIGRAVTVVAQVVAVPGEKKTDNNRQQFSVLFTR